MERMAPGRSVAKSGEIRVKNMRNQCVWDCREEKRLIDIHRQRK